MEGKKECGAIYFVGAGPGDPELITLKGQRLLSEADCVVYAGSLVNPEILSHCREDVLLHDSAGLTLEETITIMVDGYRKNQKVVRLHTGDPTIYGAIREQMELLEKENISYTVVPGVSSAFAAAAAVKKEFTLPEVSQTVILTRMAGRTPVPEKEDLGLLAQHQASMAIFLSVQDIDEVVRTLKESYPVDTPIAVVYRASWPDEEILQGTLENIASLVKEAGIRKHAQILVGKFLREEVGVRSKLYDPKFTHEYRQGNAQ